jgi:hypothetical protein
MNTDNKMNRKDAIKKAGVLMGGVVLTPALLKVIQAYSSGIDRAWEPSFFNQRQAEVVSSLSDVILPEGDTPSASQVGVPPFIESIVKDVYSKDLQNHFLEGLDEFDKETQERFDGDFFIKSYDVKQNYVLDLQNLAQNYQFVDIDHPPFIFMFRELAILGYFTSEQGASEVLLYEDVPGRYNGCIPFDEIGRTWAV